MTLLAQRWKQKLKQKMNMLQKQIVSQLIGTSKILIYLTKQIEQWNSTAVAQDNIFFTQLSNAGVAPYHRALILHNMYLSTETAFHILYF
jgi:sensor domain CHASE-containing protein